MNQAINAKHCLNLLTTTPGIAIASTTVLRRQLKTIRKNSRKSRWKSSQLYIWLYTQIPNLILKVQYDTPAYKSELHILQLTQGECGVPVILDAWVRNGYGYIVIARHRFQI